MQDMDKIIDELTLMLLYLTSWQECPTEGIRHKPIRTAEKLRLTWKGHEDEATVYRSVPLQMRTQLEKRYRLF